MRDFTRTNFVVIVVVGTLAALLVSCKREERAFSVPPSAAELPEGTDANAQAAVHAGGYLYDVPNSAASASLVRQEHEPFKRQFPMNAYALGQGQVLYNNMNCVGCHANGGGGMGPPLIDAKWLYGSEPQNIYDTIVNGRPGGMPSFRGRIPDYQIWQLVAYVRSMSGQVSKVNAPGRQDHMQNTPAPNSMSKESPTSQKAPGPTTGEAMPK